jgi:hypothetical protein
MPVYLAVGQFQSLSFLQRCPKRLPQFLRGFATDRQPDEAGFDGIPPACAAFG